MLGRIALMDIGQCQLVVNILIGEKCFESCRCFIVQALEAWLQSSAAEAYVEAFEHVEDVVSAAILKWFDEDGIAVMLVQDHDVAVSSTGWGRKFISLVSVHLAKWFDDGCKTGMGFVSIHRCQWKMVICIIVICLLG